MTGPEHYKEAERLLAYSDGPEARAIGDGAEAVAQAQVHATLALAAATVDAAAFDRATAAADQYGWVHHAVQVPTVWQEALS